jgi:hypothetical protein
VASTPTALQDLAFRGFAFLACKSLSPARPCFVPPVKPFQLPRSNPKVSSEVRGYPRAVPHHPHAQRLYRQSGVSPGESILEPTLAVAEGHLGVRGPSPGDIARQSRCALSAHRNRPIDSHAPTGPNAEGNRRRSKSISPGRSWSRVRVRAPPRDRQPMIAASLPARSRFRLIDPLGRYAQT